MTTESRASLFEGAVNALPFSVLAVDGEATIVYGNEAWHRSATVMQLLMPNTGIGHPYLSVLDSVLVVDFWRMLSAELDGVSGIEYIAYGRGQLADRDTMTLKQLWGETPMHYGT